MWLPRSYIVCAIIGYSIPMVMPTHAWSLGFNGVGSAPCSDSTHTISGTFSPSKAQYTTTGTCTTPGSLGAPRTFPYTVKGAYSNGIAEEVIEVKPAPISQPSHPYGTWRTKYSCPSDPWLTVDGPPFGPESIRVKCPIIQRYDNSPSESYPRKYQDGKPLPSLTDLFDAWRAQKPMTSWALMPAERAALAAKRDADLAALAKAEANKRVRKATQPMVPYIASLSPIVVAPTAGQNFLSQTAVPIRLRPPQQWVDTQVGLDGRPVNTNRLYMVRLERKDSAGNWVAHTALAVGAVQAESATGYTGFGAGAPPGGVTVPGTWRLSAQMTAPQQTGWSDWIQFVVMAPVTNKALRAPKGFAK